MYFVISFTLVAPKPAKIALKIMSLFGIDPCQAKMLLAIPVTNPPINFWEVVVAYFSVISAPRRLNIRRVLVLRIDGFEGEISGDDERRQDEGEESRDGLNARKAAKNSREREGVIRVIKVGILVALVI